MNDLGYFKEYGHMIIPLVLLSWGSLYTFLCNDYGCIDD